VRRQPVASSDDPGRARGGGDPGCADQCI